MDVDCMISVDWCLVLIANKCVKTEVLPNTQYEIEDKMHLLTLTV